ncbi:MAG: phosphopeptide-binding protein [Halothiobacillus sp. 14-55-98]|jgi:pSer/pThr/pTyr-binding forkhead associated (FHA) protein|nr:MAG: phosphopeptide-binding protein [Halothiobacillus sp. 14-55-98]
MENVQYQTKPQYAGTQGTLLVAKNDDRIHSLDETEQPAHINLDQPALIGLTPPFINQRFTLRQGKTTIGRRADNNIVLADGSVSSLHAWIIEDNGQYRVMNILSTNGSFVNDARITEAPLQDGDRIRFGGVELQLHTGLANKKTASSGKNMLLAFAAIGIVALVALGWVFMR